MKNILITALGTSNASAIINALRKYDKSFRLIGSDIYPKECIANSLFVDEFYQFPRSDVETNKYVDYLFKFCKQHKIDFVYSVIDEEVNALAFCAERFMSIGTKVCIPNKEMVQICHDKRQFALWLHTNMPKYCIRTYDAILDIEKYPIFIKPVFGRASNGCKKVDSYRELKALHLDLNKYLMQEYVEGEIISVDVVSNQKYKQFQCCQKKEILRNSNGCGIAVEIINNRRIEKTCREVVDKLKVNGVINIELFASKNSIKIIEINPRLSAGTSFSCLAGLDTVIQALHISEGVPCDLDLIHIGSQFAKRYETYQTR